MIIYCNGKNVSGEYCIFTQEEKRCPVGLSEGIEISCMRKAFEAFGHKLCSSAREVERRWVDNIIRRAGWYFQCPVIRGQIGQFTGRL